MLKILLYILLFIFVLTYLLIAIGLIKVIRQEHMWNQNAMNLYFKVTQKWKKNAFVAPDETLLCSRAFGDLLITYPPYGKESSEGKCNEHEFEALKEEFVEHGYPVDTPEQSNNYFIVHMPQKKSAT